MRCRPFFFHGFRCLIGLGLLPLGGGLLLDLRPHPVAHGDLERFIKVEERLVRVGVLGDDRTYLARPCVERFRDHVRLRVRADAEHAERVVPVGRVGRPFLPDVRARLNAQLRSRHAEDVRGEVFDRATSVVRLKDSLG